MENKMNIKDAINEMEFIPDCSDEQDKINKHISKIEEFADSIEIIPNPDIELAKRQNK